MEKAHELEWLEAQQIGISVDLVAAAKQQLEFLTAVDKYRCLYEGSALNKAIYRYKMCWLPLLAKQNESMLLDGPVVVPLDCEWIWHCHRLNPVQYKKDCEKFYGQILDNHNVVSMVQGASIEKTAEIWNKLYPGEPYELDLAIPFLEVTAEKFSEVMDNIKYDLVSAVKRQSTFGYQVSRPSMHDDCFLVGAVARYKGFLHLIKRNAERSMKRFCVPTYDIDLIWHSHQLSPRSYCKDTVEAVGKVLEHDDTDSDRSKGKKLDTGFSATKKQWEMTFGSRYWRAGAMYRGSAPSPVTVSPWPVTFVGKDTIPCNNGHQELRLTKTEVVEALLEILSVRNLPSGHKGNLFVTISKNQPDLLFKSRKRLSILSESGETQIVAFQCEPAGELVFSLKSQYPSNLPIPMPAKTLGTASIPVQEFLDPVQKLSVQKWFELVPNADGTKTKPICLQIAASLTVPVSVLNVLSMVRSRPFSVNTCFLPLSGKVQQLKGWTCIVDDAGNEILSLQMRNSKETDAGNNHIAKRELIGVMGSSGETLILAEFVGNQWALLDSTWSLQLDKRTTSDGHIFELKGNEVIKLFPGRKLEFEPRCCQNEKKERDFVTVVRFSRDHPYGKAVALFNLKYGAMKIDEEWFSLLGTVLAFILSDMLKREGYSSFVSGRESMGMEFDLNEKAYANQAESVDVIGTADLLSTNGSTVAAQEEGSGCGGECGSACVDMVKDSILHDSVNGCDNIVTSCSSCDESGSIVMKSATGCCSSCVDSGNIVMKSPTGCCASCGESGDGLNNDSGAIAACDVSVVNGGALGNDLKTAPGVGGRDGFKTHSSGCGGGCGGGSGCGGCHSTFSDKDSA